MKAHERLLKYVKYGTVSDDNSTSVPSTDAQFTLADALVEELKALGIDNAFVDDKCYVYAYLPCTKGYESVPAIGFIAHMDTAPDFEGNGCAPVIYENYNGEDVVLGNSRRVLKVSSFPHLKSLKGQTLITTNGETLLGADDKAGIADILTAIERIINENIPHGKICIGFTPDEEIGRGADHFDTKLFGAEFAYTIDGGVAGEIEYENFNAASAEWTINGTNVHPGSAKGIMVNAAQVAFEINDMLPKGEVPEKTEGYEGFYHLCDVTGNVEIAHLYYIVRDHSANAFEAKLNTLRLIERLINEKYGDGTAKLTIEEQYRNMKEKILPCFHVVETAKRVMESLGITPKEVPIRGGTDGARLSYMGLPCPNLGTGGFACHGPFEHVTAEQMELCVQIIIGIIKEYAKR